MPLLADLTTAKAYASALSTGVAAALAAGLPFVDGFWSALFLVVLAVLGSYGVVYRVPNAPARREEDRGPLGGLLDPGSGAPPA